MGSDAQRKSRGAGSMKRQQTWEDGGAQVVASKKRFVGVRQRPSGRWVAEIKDTTQKIRLWLGTFDSAEEGAKAYDSAARALRGANTRTNFVTPMSSCESTPSASSKATRLIRLRQIAAANAKLQTEAAKLGHGADVLVRHDVNPQPTCSNSDERHSQVATPLPLLISSPPKPARVENAPSGGDSEHIEPVSPSPHENISRDTAAASLPPPPPPPPPPLEKCCNSTSEVATLAATASGETSAVSAFSCSSESSSLHSCASSGANSSSSDQVDAMIPWSDYVLVDGLDLPSTCEFAVYASAFDFSAEAMDRDSCTSLLEDHTSLRDSDVDDSTEFPNFAMSSESSDMDRVEGHEICSGHDLVWSRSYKGRCAAT